VVGDRREVERAVELDRAQRVSGVVERLNADRLAAGEPPGVFGAEAGGLGVGVQAERGVDVQIAPQHPSERVVVGAAGERLAGGRRRGRVVAGRERHTDEK
jgi:hypothetical protein